MKAPKSLARGCQHCCLPTRSSLLSNMEAHPPDGQQEDEGLRVLGVELLDGALAVLQRGGTVDAQVLHGTAAQRLQTKTRGAV